MLEGILSFIFPPYCLGCFNDGPSYCCASCLRQIELFRDSCPLCNYPSTPGRVCGWCLGDTPLDGLYIAAPYDQPLLPELLMAFKFEGVRSLASELGTLLRPLLTYCPKKSILLPLPLSWWRQQERGFNQSELLARATTKAGGTEAGTPLARRPTQSRLSTCGVAQVTGPAVANLLLKRRWSFRQSKLNETERAKNVHGKFSCPQPELVKNKTIILLDDLYTTGATLQEAARVLKQAGAKKVMGLALAKG